VYDAASPANRHSSAGTLQASGRSDQHRRSLSAALLALGLIIFPFVGSPFALDLASQVFLASIGSLSLMLLTGFAGQISIGHAGLIAAGAYVVGIMSREWQAPFWLTLPSAAIAGASLGAAFGLPSLRLRGLYLAVSTLALYFIVIYAGGEYEAWRGYATGIMIDSPKVAGMEISSGFAWYFILLAAAVMTLVLCINLLRSRTGRAWGAIRTRETVAEALGIHIAKFKLWAFVISSAITAVAGALFAYNRNFVSAEAFSLYLSIQYVAMIIIGGMGSLPGAILGATFVTLFPYAIESAIGMLPDADRYVNALYAMNYAAFGLVTIAFLLFEPRGLIGIWRRLQGHMSLRLRKPKPPSGPPQ
jgi:branched-chain amino acid transport system permease protein